MSLHEDVPFIKDRLEAQRIARNKKWKARAIIRDDQDMTGPEKVKALAQIDRDYAEFLRLSAIEQVKQVKEAKKLEPLPTELPTKTSNVPKYFKFPPTFDEDSSAQVVDYKIYIQGVEMTAFVENFSVTMDMDFGAVDVTFKDANSVLTLTRKNVFDGIWKTSPEHPQFSEQQKKEIYDWKVAHNTQGPNGKLEFENLRRWPLGPNQSIFHRMDTIRIFVRVPWLNKKEPNQWLPTFNGYLTSVSSSQSFGQGAENTITISGQNLKYVMKKMRLSQNPMVTSQGTLADTVLTNAGLFSDTLLPDKQLTNVLYNKQPKEMVSYLVFGRYYTPNTTDKAGTLHAIGELKHSEDHQRFFVHIAPSASKGGKNEFDLEEWHNACVYGTDEKGETRVKPLTLAEVIKQGKSSAFGDVYSAHGSNIIARFLEPRDGFGYTTLVEQKVNNLTSYEADWVTRLDLLDSILSPLYYKFWISGAGDLIFEYPLVDFKPTDFGDYKNLLKVNAYDSQTFSESDVPVPTIITVNGGSPTTQSTQVGNTGERFFKVDLVFPSLAARFGVEHETVSFPYTFNGDQLVQVGLITLQQRMSELEGFSLSGIPLLFGMTPNRPIEVPKLDMLLSITSLSFSVNSSGSGSSMTLALDFPRKRESDDKFRTIFGTESLPFSYHEIFDQSEDLKSFTGDSTLQTANVFYVVAQSDKTTDTGGPETNDSLRITAKVDSPNPKAKSDIVKIEAQGGENSVIADNLNTAG